MKVYSELGFFGSLIFQKTLSNVNIFNETFL